MVVEIGTTGVRRIVDEAVVVIVDSIVALLRVLGRIADRGAARDRRGSRCARRRRCRCRRHRSDPDRTRSDRPALGNLDRTGKSREPVAVFVDSVVAHELLGLLAGIIRGCAAEIGRKIHAPPSPSSSIPSSHASVALLSLRVDGRIASGCRRESPRPHPRPRRDRHHRSARDPSP